MPAKITIDRQFLIRPELGFYDHFGLTPRQVKDTPASDSELTECHIESMEQPEADALLASFDQSVLDNSYVESLRESIRELIKQVAIKKIKEQSPLLTTTEQIELLILIGPMLDQTNAPPAITQSIAIYQHAQSRRSFAATASREQLESFDVFNDPGWPA